MKRMTTETLLDDTLVDWAIVKKHSYILEEDAYVKNVDNAFGKELEATVHHRYSPTDGCFLTCIRFRTKKEKMESICEKYNLHVDQIAKGIYFLASN